MKILYRTLMICMFLFLGSNLFAQFHPYWNYRQEEKPIVFGIRAGVGASDISKVVDNGALIGFKGGVTVDFRIKDPIYIQSGVDFAMKGARGRSNGRYHMNYVQVPIHLAYKPWIGNTYYSRFVVYGGGYFAYGLGGKALVYNVSTQPTVEYETFETGMFKKFDAGVSFGIGFEVNQHFVLNVGAEIGLVNISDFGADIPSKETKEYPKGTSYFGDNCKNRVFYATVGYKF